MFCIRQRSLFSLIFIALTLLFLTTALTTATAQVPVSFSHQGRLIGPDGEPAQGAVELTFTIYNSDRGGEILWQEVHTTDLGDSGFYSLTLGSEDNPLDASLFGDTPTFMGVQVNNNPELNPRIPFNSVPYAAVADRAQSATVADSVSPGSIGPEALANNFTISWSDIEDTPAAIQGLDYTNAPTSLRPRIHP